MAVPQPLGDTAIRLDGPGPTGPWPLGVVDVVTAFGVTAVHFDPTATDFERVAAWARSASQSNPAASAVRLVEIPVLYDGPDLAKVGGDLSTDEVIKRHAAAEYRVGAVGFQPGFGYLVGLPDELKTARRATPRTRVPAGSVAIGGPYTGVYPSDSPGGWNLIGRTPIVMWDESRPEPSMLAPCERVRFRPIDQAEFDRLAQARSVETTQSEPPIENPAFRVLSPGMQTTLLGLPRPGRQNLGVSPGGAMDGYSHRLANLLVGNEPSALALEATLVGPVLEALEPVIVAVSGAVPGAAARQLGRGETLDLRRLVGGARAYVAIPGGFAGRVGKTLMSADLVGATKAPTDAPIAASGRTLTSAAWLRGSNPVLRVLRGPQAARFDSAAWDRFLTSPFRVSPNSSRMGIRVEGPAIVPADDQDLPSQPTCHGAVQVPPDGQPIVLGADRQTLGGYPILAVVASVDWPVLGQLRPGHTVRFAEIDLPTAQRLRRRSERDLAIAATALLIS